MSRSRLGLLCAAFLLAFGIPAAPSHALGIPSGGIKLEVLDAAGQPETRAGAHPARLLMSFAFSDLGGPPEDLKDMAFDLSPGLGGNPNAVPLCPRRLFSEQPFDRLGCPPESQIGVLTSGSGNGKSSFPLYSVEPGPNEVALFGATRVIPVKFVASLRPGDQGLSLRLGDIPQFSQLAAREGQIELWGVPADRQEGTAIPRRPLLTMPTSCGGAPISATLRAHTWQQPDRLVSGSDDAGQALSGCGDLPFDPGLEVSYGTPVADAPSGAVVGLTVPQDDDPDRRASSQVKDISIVLPEGTMLSPASASALGVCTDTQLGAGTAAEATCPVSSRLGTVEIKATALSKPMVGSIYLGQQHPGDRFRVFAVAAGMGSEVKLVASLRPDPDSGQLTVALHDLPPVALDRLVLHFDGGPRAPLVTPLTCGPATTTARLTPYSGGPTQVRAVTIGIRAPNGAPCSGVAPFEPEFSGGTTTALAGRDTSLTATMSRRDGEQLPERLEMDFPPGVSAALAGVDRCPAAAAAASCPASSRIGGTVAELGPGADPAPIRGDVYLMGPYRRAPFGVALAFPAAIGPFDLGTLVLRGTLQVDPLTGQISVAGDPLPSVFEGIPVRFQTIGLDLDRRGFLRNPTSCAGERMTLTLRSATGAVARPASPFAVRNCIDLPFRPAFSVALAERAELHAGGRPAVRISARLPPRGANLRMADISLPSLLRFDSSGLREICARREARNGNCPSGSRIGSSYARTPLLDVPLKGAVYVVQPRDTGSPDLWISLEGEGLQIYLRGETALEDGHVVTRLIDLPDLPLASFAMRLAGGKHGVFALSSSPCRALVASLTLKGQSGARRKGRVRVAVPGECGDG
jgi:hypothetical protein